MPGAWTESESDPGFQSDHDFGSDCVSESDDDEDHGHDPDFDLSGGCFNHNTNACFSCLAPSDVPGGLPVSVRSNLALQNILP